MTANLPDDVLEWDSPAVLQPCRRAKLASATEDKGARVIFAWHGSGSPALRFRRTFDTGRRPEPFIRVANFAFVPNPDIAF
jgi:hypothetical protein